MIAANETTTITAITNDDSSSLLPILIIPGFMSSGLEIVESSLKPNWKRQRLWLNLSSLGLSAIYFGSATQDTNETTTGDDESSTQLKYKSTWLEHMRLAGDLKSEIDGVQVRAIAGLEGVDYLTPGMFTNLVSYVFGPVINALLATGYTSDVNLKAAPYDWRLPPCELERRDQYFTKTIQQVEQLYNNSHSKPVVLLCHSLGTKTAHYFLNFCLAHKGQAWIDQHIHTYLPVGAPHLGAPKALRSLITGDKMSLDTFLGDSEALALGRSFGSGAWLLPKELPPNVPPNAYLAPHGVLQISLKSSLDTVELTERREAYSIPHRFQLMAVLVTNLDGSRKITTPFHHTPSTVVDWDEGQFSFATSPTIPNAKQAVAKLQFILNEPGIKAAKFERSERRFHPVLCFLNWLFCCCLWTCLCRLVGKILGGVATAFVLSADSISSLNSKQATPLALSEVLDIPPSVWKGKSVSMDVSLVHESDYGKLKEIWCSCKKQKQRTATITVELKWTPHRDAVPVTAQQCSAISQPSMTTTTTTTSAPSSPALRITSSGISTPVYAGTSGYDIMEREGLATSIKLMKEDYDADPLEPRTTQPPPIRRIHAIYGTNLPTETGAVYRRGDTYSSPDTPIQSLYVLDTAAKIDAGNGTSAAGHHSVEKGILMEKPALQSGSSSSGDGTVPYWSLKHVETWKTETCQVTIEELDKAEHREILADPRFHASLIRYCQVPKETV